MNLEDDQDLWDLLGKVRTSEPSPFFARNVVRQVRLQTFTRFGLGELLARWKLIAASGIAAAIILAGAALHISRSSTRQSTVVKPASAVSHDADFDSDINDLVASSDESDDDDVVVL